MSCHYTLATSLREVSPVRGGLLLRTVEKKMGSLQERLYPSAQDSSEGWKKDEMAWLFGPKMQTALLLCFQDLPLRDLVRGVDSLVYRVPSDTVYMSVFPFSGLSGPRCLTAPCPTSSLERWITVCLMGPSSTY